VSEPVGITHGVDVVKMSGAGNDFLLLGPEAIERLGDGLEAWVRLVCRRRLSVGADGVLLVRPLGGDRVDVRFHNPDGSRAFCGNGSRCAARFARLKGMAGASMVLATDAGDVVARVSADGVSLWIAAPRDDGRIVVDLPGKCIEGRAIFAGTPHVVSWVEEIECAPLERWGPAVRGHARFAPVGVNFNVVERAGDRVRIRTWEKGVERETLACGSGAIAAAAAARAAGAGDCITVIPASGIPLEVRFESSDEVVLTGDARVIFEGSVGDEATRGFGSA